MNRILAGLLITAVAAGAQAQATPPARVPPPVPAARPVATRPAGSTLRCKDGAWADAGAADSWCSTHGGIGYRTVVVTPPPKALSRPEAAPAKPPAPPETPSMVETPATTRTTTTAKAAKAAKAPTAPPPGATLLCVDGTYLTGSAEADRCQGHGGLAGKLPVGRP